MSEKKAGGPFGGLTAAEAAQRSAEARRTKRAEREAAAELDRLTSIARAGVVAASVLTAEEQTALLRAQLEKGKAGHVQSARFVLDWLTRLGPGAPDDAPEHTVSFEDMSPAQRAAARAQLIRELHELEAEREPQREADERGASDLAPPR